MTNSADPDQKPTDLDLHCLQRQGISGVSRTRVKVPIRTAVDNILKYIFLYLSFKENKAWHFM